jgi:protein SHQ1
LTLPGKVVETDDSSAKYVSDDSNFVITLDKVTPGQHFPNLDMISTLLKPKENKKVMKPLIEVMEGKFCLNASLLLAFEFHLNF